MADPATASTATTLVVDLGTFGVLGVAVIGGALGGLASHFAAPVAEDTKLDRWRWLKASVIGAAAAIAVLYALMPDTTVALAGLAVGAGYAGKAVLGAVETRLKLSAARHEASVARADRASAVEAARVATGVAERALREAASSTPRAEILSGLEHELFQAKSALVAHPLGGSQ
jgi:hypothetical protein